MLIPPIYRILFGRRLFYFKTKYLYCSDYRATVFSKYGLQLSNFSQHNLEVEIQYIWITPNWGRMPKKLSKVHAGLEKAKRIQHAER